MGGVMRFVFALIWIAFILGIAGELIDISIYSKQQAEKVYESKGVSARWWNGKLTK